MASLLLIMFVGVSSLLALTNWRAGMLLCVIAGLLQDPVRKVTTGTPAYLTLAFVPIYLAMLVALWSSVDVIGSFRRYYPRLFAPAGIFLLALLASTVQTLSYGLETISLALLGLFSYGGGIPALMLGFFYVRKDFGQLDRSVIVCVALISLMLIGVPLEYYGFRFADPWLGTIAMAGVWRRWYSPTEWIEMISGFYRSPEIMGWHAATLVVLCIYLIARRPAWIVLWGSAATWGLVCMLLSGRRKMLLIVAVFLVVFLLLSKGWRRSRLLLGLTLASVVVVPMLGMLVEDRYVLTAKTSLVTGGARVTSQAVSGPLWLLGIIGPFGYGVGSKTQGAQHLNLSIPAPLTEGGFEKIMVELGIVGTLAFFLVGIALARCIPLCFRRVRFSGLDGTTPAACTAFIVANMAAFVTAFQIYGDPFVVFFIGFAGGVLLSSSRLAEQRVRAAKRAHVKVKPSDCNPIPEVAVP